MANTAAGGNAHVRPVVSGKRHIDSLLRGIVPSIIKRRRIRLHAALPLVESHVVPARLYLALLSCTRHYVITAVVFACT